MQKEIWKDIIGYEGLYQVSNLGKVKSFVNKKPKILKGWSNGKGYLLVDLNNKGKRKTIQIHQLVAIAFLNHKPCGLKLVVNHIDFNKQNNNVNNLEVVTNRKNCNRKHIKSVSKYVGVCWDKYSNKWMAKIQINGKCNNLGRFKNEYDAHLAYQKALKNITNNEI